MVVAGSLCRFLQIGFNLTAVQVEIRRKPLARTVVKIILGVEACHGIVGFSEVLHLAGLTHRLILTRHMVRHKVDDDFQTSSMGTFNQLFELMHSLGHIDRQVWVNVIIVGNGIGRPRLALHNGRVLASLANGSIPP